MADLQETTQIEPIVPRPGWTLEDEYRALSAEFIHMEEERDRLERACWAAHRALRDNGRI